MAWPKSSGVQMLPTEVPHVLDNKIDQRLRRAWDFFLANSGDLLLASLVVLLLSLLVIPAPWLMLNLLQEVVESARSGRPVEWKACYRRKGNFWKSWGLTLAMGVPIIIGYALLIVPGVLLSMYWLHAPVLAADGRGVMDALRESGDLFRRRDDWAAYFMNWLVLVVLSSLPGVVAFIVMLTFPVSMVFLAFCTADELGTATLLPSPKSEVRA